MIGRLDDEEGIDREEVAEPHARLTILSHLFVAAMFDNEGWTLDVEILLFDVLGTLGLEVVFINGSGVG